jgi:hypothetical protein
MKSIFNVKVIVLYPPPQARKIKQNHRCLSRTRGRMELKMKTKRIIAALTAAVMALSVTIPSFAEESVPAADGYIALPVSPGTTQTSGSDINLQAALTNVKKRVTIPDYLSVFNYTTSTYNDITTYRFTWSQEGKSGGEIVPLKDSAGRTTNSISVTVVGNIITRYNKYYNYKDSIYSTSGASLGKLPIEKFESTAKANVEKLNPGMSSHLKFGKPSASLYSQSVSLSFSRIENGIDVKSNSGSVVFDKNTGDITSFRVTWWDDATFKATTGILTEADMEKAFTSAIGLEKEYRIQKDYAKKTVTAQIVYKPEDNYEFDAFTGKKSTIWEDYEKAMQTTGMEVAESGEGLALDDAEMAMAEESASNDAVAFTEAEQKAIAENANMIKRDAATAIILKDPYIGLTTEYQLQSGNLYTKNDFGVTNTWQLYYLINTDKKYASINVSLDADSGKILSFSKDGYDKKDGKPVTTATAKFDEAKADKKSAEAFNYYMKDIIGEFKDDKNATSAIFVSNDIGQTDELESKSYRKNRYHDNIIVVGDYAYMNIDSYGDITSFGYNYTNVKFPSSTTLTEKEAYGLLFGQIDINVFYNGFVGRSGKASTYLNFNINSFTINAKTGKLSDYYGNPITPSSQSEIAYSDIKGTKYETAVNTLLAYNVYITPTGSSRFSAGSTITQGEFSKLISNIFGGTQIEQADKAKSLTKADAAKLYVEATGGGDYAKLKGIYKSPYPDVPENHAYVGYIAIAKAEGVFTGSGNFSPDSSLTRGDAILMIYEIVK